MSQEADMSLPMSKWQIEDFAVYNHEIPSWRANRPVYGRSVNGKVRDGVGYYTNEYRSCPKSYFQKTARVWMRASKAWVRKRCMEGEQASHMPGWTGLTVKISGTKLDIIKSLKIFVNRCPEAITLLEEFACPLVAYPPQVSSMPTPVWNSDCVLRNEMNWSDSESEMNHRYASLMWNQEVQAGGGSDEEMENEGEEVAQEEGYLESIDEVLAEGIVPMEEVTNGEVIQHMVELFMSQDENQNLSEDELTERFIDFMAYLDEENSVSEENPLDKLGPEPELPSSLPESVKTQLTCPITYEIYREPVIDHEGNTYERVAILNHLKKNKTSPMTRNELEEKDLAPNRAVKDLIQALVQWCGN